MYPLTVLKWWDIVLFKTLSLALLTVFGPLSKKKSFPATCSWAAVPVACLLLACFALRPAFRFISKAGDAQGETNALFHYTLFSRRFEMWLELPFYLGVPFSKPNTVGEGLRSPSRMYHLLLLQWRIDCQCYEQRVIWHGPWERTTSAHFWSLMWNEADVWCGVQTKVPDMKPPEKLESKVSPCGFGSLGAWATPVLPLVLLLSPPPLLPLVLVTPHPGPVDYTGQRGSLYFYCFCNLIDWQGAKVPTYLQVSFCEDPLKGTEKCCVFFFLIYVF